MIDAWITQNADDLQVGLFFGLFIVFALVEVLAPCRPRPGGQRLRWFTNLTLTALNIVVLSSLPVTFFAVAVWAQARGLGVVNAVEMPVTAAIFATLLVRAFLSFFTHYILHKVPWLWRVHRVHHLDTEMDVSTTVRFHPLEFVVNLVVAVPLLTATGAVPWALLVYEVLDAAVTVFSHANIRLPKWLERSLHFVIVTPDLHRIHHSSYQPETDSNFGAVFPIWDILLGTFRTVARVPQETMELGLGEVRDDRADRIGWLLSSPFQDLTAPGDTSGAPPLRRRGSAS